ncbi:MAG TPA: sensor histidine kinase [Bryobacteraceae bacterium]|nr:sensor histidine kinase [Bryobacteraceae bacterium]
MPDDFAALPEVWRRIFPWVRAAFAAAGLAVAILSWAASTPWRLAAGGVFLAISVLVPFRKHAGGAFALFVLFIDVVYFLVLVSGVNAAMLWLPAFYYLYVLAEALFFYRAPEVLTVALVSMVFCFAVPAQNEWMLRRTTVIAGMLAYAFALYKRRLDSRMAEIVAESAQIREDASRAQTTERERIASDFHDGPLQSFISLQMRLVILRKILERDLRAGMDELTGLQKLAEQQVKELRAFVRSMRPPEMGANLYASARRICENFQKESGIPVTFVGGDGPLKLPEETAGEVIQMLRESLHNVLKHASATRVAVSMEHAAKMLEISVDDNGRGFPFSGVYTLDELELLRLGPASLKRRARAVNADMTLESRPGRGAGLKLRVPAP